MTSTQIKPTSAAWSRESSNDEPDVAVGMRLMAVKSPNLPVDLQQWISRKKYCNLGLSAGKHRPGETHVTHCYSVPKTHLVTPSMLTVEEEPRQMKRI